MTKRAASIAYLLVIFAVSGWGCVSQVPLEGSLCPCGEPGSGFKCCDGMCVGASTVCRAKPGPNGDAGVAETHEVTPPGDGGLPEVQVVKSPFIRIAIGRAHACGVRLDGTIACRGDDSKGQASPPPGLFQYVVAGGDHTCGQILDPYDIVKNDSWTCWGDNSHGESTVPPDRFVNVVAGERHNCGLVREPDDALKVKCWGDNSTGQSSPPPLNSYLSDLVAGRAHTCGLTLVGAGARSVVCWGDGSRGQTTVPDFGRDLPTEGRFYTLAAGSDHTCLIETFGLTKCWGDNDHGQSTATPSTFNEFSTATGHSCGIPLGGFKSGEILCFGSEWGDSMSTPPPGKMVHVVAGDWLNCGIPSDDAQPTICWGKTYEPWY